MCIHFLRIYVYIYSVIQILCVWNITEKSCSDSYNGKTLFKTVAMGGFAIGQRAYVQLWIQGQVGIYSQWAEGSSGWKFKETIRVRGFLLKVGQGFLYQRCGMKNLLRFQGWGTLAKIGLYRHGEDRMTRKAKVKAESRRGPRGAWLKFGQRESLGQNIYLAHSDSVLKCSSPVLSPQQCAHPAIPLHIFLMVLKVTAGAVVFIDPGVDFPSKLANSSVEFGFRTDSAALDWLLTWTNESGNLKDVASDYFRHYGKTDLQEDRIKANVQSSCESGGQRGRKNGFLKVIQSPVLLYFGGPA